MLKYLFAFIMLIHGFIHFMGFAKAYNYGNITQISKQISKPCGIGALKNRKDYDVSHLSGRVVPTGIEPVSKV